MSWRASPRTWSSTSTDLPRRRGVSSGAAAIGGLVLLCLGWWLFSGNGPGGPDGTADRFGVPQTEATAPATGAPPSPTPQRGSVAIDGFVPEEGNHVALNYTSAPERCVGTLDTPQVVETDAAVTVTLTLVPPESPPRRCPEPAEQHTVRVLLDAPLEGRSLLDGSRAQPVRVEQVPTTNE